MPKYGKARSRSRRRVVRRRSLRFRKKGRLNRRKRRIAPAFRRGKSGNPRRQLVPERKTITTALVAESAYPGTPVGRVNMTSFASAGYYHLGFNTTPGSISSFMPNIVRGFNHLQRIGTEIFMKTMDLRMRFVQQRNCVSPIKFRVVIYRYPLDYVSAPGHDPVKPWVISFLNFPYFLDNVSRYDIDQVKKMAIIHDKTYTLKGDSVPQTFAIGSVSTPGQSDITEISRSHRYLDVHIFKKLNFKLKYDDLLETAGKIDCPGAVAITVLPDSGNCGGVPYVSASPHQMPASSGANLTWNCKWTYTDV